MPEGERRQNERMHAAIPLTIEILGTPLPPPPLTVETNDISLQGLSIIITIKTKSEQGRLSIQEGEDPKLVKYLLLDNKRLQLGINILPQDQGIPAIGRVKWCYRSLDRDCYYVKAGIMIEEMERKYQERWFEFLKTVYQFMVGLGNGAR
jgi:hypothetical protein